MANRQKLHELKIVLPSDNYALPTDDIVEFSVEPFSKEIQEIDEQLLNLQQQTDQLSKQIDQLTPKADKLDYGLAISSGIITGLIDVFFVGQPGESALTNWTDEQVNKIVKNFANTIGWNPREGNEENVKSAIGFLERKFKVSFDNTTVSGEGITGLTQQLSTKNHHYQSLAHSPTLLGLVFSIIDQFTNKTHLILDGKLISVTGTGHELSGGNWLAKFFAGIWNWFGHLMSDVAGSSGAIERGTGLPGPFLSLVNYLATINSVVGEPLDLKKLGHFASKLFQEGYDIRFETAQAMPVLLNELLIRMVYMIRRLIQHIKSGQPLAKLKWEKIEPFKNSTVKRMLTVGHGTFVAIDVADAAIRAAAKSKGSIEMALLQFALRVNIAGVGRFAISLGGEISRANTKRKYRNERMEIATERLFLSEAKLFYKQAGMWEQAIKTEKLIVEVEQMDQTARQFAKDSYQEIVQDTEKVNKSVKHLNEQDRQTLLDILD